jgi:hypothetical protein
VPEHCTALHSSARRARLCESGLGGARGWVIPLSYGAGLILGLTCGVFVAYLIYDTYMHLHVAVAAFFCVFGWVFLLMWVRASPALFTADPCSAPAGCVCLLPLATCDMQHAKCPLQLCNTQHGTCNMRHAPCNMQHATCPLQHATCDVSRTGTGARGLRCAILLWGGPTSTDGRCSFLARCLLRASCCLLRVACCLSSCYRAVRRCLPQVLVLLGAGLYALALWCSTRRARAFDARNPEPMPNDAI